MTLSIDVLPAPFGPMMARISPLRMSNETSFTAFTPPNESDTFSTDKSTSPTATSGPPVALMRRLRSRGRQRECATRRMSCRLLHGRRRRHRFHVADLHPRLDRALAAVLEGHFGRDVGFLGAVIERRHQRPVALGDEAAAHLLGAGEFAVVGVELLVQDEETLDL